MPIEPPQPGTVTVPLSIAIVDDELLNAMRSVPPMAKPPSDNAPPPTGRMTRLPVMPVLADSPSDAWTTSRLRPKNEKRPDADSDVLAPLRTIVNEPCVMHAPRSEERR